MLYGPWAELADNQAVLQTHRDHAELQGHSMHVLDRQIMHGMWSKLSYMLMLVLEELAKPEDERMKWLFWFDLDIIVMNRNVPLDVFLPPEDGFSHINLLVTNDHNGLNSGSFFLRVSEWAVKYLIDIIALHSYKPEFKLKYSDQSAQEVMTLDTRYKANTLYVPQRWFNAYRGPRNDREQLVRGEKVPANTIKAGDLQLHFAGKKVKHLIPTYLALAANNSMGWEMPLKKTKLQMEIALFWKLTKERQDWDQPVPSKKKAPAAKVAVAAEGAGAEALRAAAVKAENIRGNSVIEQISKLGASVDADEGVKHELGSAMDSTLAQGESDGSKEDMSSDS
ncbi:Putative glycosyltransferase 34, nucleotide-diphospho-sugar transferase [Septoria linicola]|uniref:Glycosyltransferase 34, nucleotide-diphospho-sugar transferase n=1 Tax=Septoria linicola TaxID=215465 RepID=A0A9Q9B000_9PEZI|nr:Putative glycosyltransferase 34, nucleotide-diphospho-sugar transferase [Septoria linicola]